MRMRFHSPVVYCCGFSYFPGKFISCKNCFSMPLWWMVLFLVFFNRVYYEACWGPRKKRVLCLKYRCRAALPGWKKTVVGRQRFAFSISSTQPSALSSFQILLFCAVWVFCALVPNEHTQLGGLSSQQSMPVAGFSGDLHARTYGEVEVSSCDTLYCKILLFCTGAVACVAEKGCSAEACLDMFSGFEMSCSFMYGITWGCVAERKLFSGTYIS